MDSLLKQFEQLSLPSRVNWNEITENSLDRIFNLAELVALFEALKGKNDVTPFQWRKLRESSLISLKPHIKEPEVSNFLINVYEESVLFSLREKDFAECHIAMTKLLDFYSLRNNYNLSMLQTILLFRYYTGVDSVGSVIECVQFILPKELQSDTSVTRVFEIIRCCSKMNLFTLRLLLETEKKFNEGSRIVLQLIEKKLTKQVALQLSKAYQLTSESWATRLLNVESIDKLFDLGLDREKIQINEGKIKFLRSKVQ